jgi:hypothetical protein
VLWFDDCSKIGNKSYIIECQWFSRQHLGNKKSNKKLHYRYRLQEDAKRGKGLAATDQKDRKRQIG